MLAKLRRVIVQESADLANRKAPLRPPETHLSIKYDSILNLQVGARVSRCGNYVLPATFFMHMARNYGAIIMILYCYHLPSVAERRHLWCELLTRQPVLCVCVCVILLFCEALDLKISSKITNYFAMKIVIDSKFLRLWSWCGFHCLSEDAIFETYLQILALSSFRDWIQIF